MESTLNNLFSLKKPQEGDESFATLFENPHIRIEGIRSNQKMLGQIYDQQEDEWVLLVRGKASLKIIDTFYDLKSGDFLLIPKRTPHQVVSTDEDTIWLGIFAS